jgi:hypothetical protein
MRNRRHGGILGGQFISVMEEKRDSKGELAKTGPMDRLHAKMQSHHATHTTGPIPALGWPQEIPHEQYSHRII